MDDISPLEQVRDRTLTENAALFDIRPATAWVTDIQRQITVGGQKVFRGENPPAGTDISYWLKSRAKEVTIEISDIAGTVVRTLNGTTTPGLNRVRWTLQATPVAGRGFRGGGRGRGGFGPPVPPGTYLVKVTVDGTLVGQKTLTIDADHLD
jgi:hypothetical protein